MTDNGPSTDTSLRNFIELCFPSGTSEGVSKSIEECPSFPPDLFGVSAVLMKQSGAYSMYCSNSMTFSKSASVYQLTKMEVQQAVDLGKAWRLNTPIDSLSASVPPKVTEYWNELLSFGKERIYTVPREEKPAPDWWKIAHTLLIIADEASYGVGRYTTPPTKGPKVSWVDKFVKIISEMDLNKSISANPKINSNTAGETIPFRPTEPSITQNLNLDIACVQPKNKTSDVGCTLRTLSQNLALLPPRGEIRTHWLRPPAAGLGEPSRAGLNVLLIPYPYRINPESFESNGPSSKKTAWKWFELRQQWLPGNSHEVADFLKFVSELIKAATASNENVQAVVFPELSLNWELYEKVLDMIKERFPEVELLIAGSSTNCHGDEGNFVITANFYDAYCAKSDDTHRTAVVVSRPKHHRWRIDKYQKEAYGLTKGLKNADYWWERIPLPHREVHANVFREGTTFTALICEDLARAEPCHDTIRALGSNLVFVLLMDGPQLERRWSARYSMGLAEDPGLSVLTFTSRAMLDLTNRVRKDRAAQEQKAGTAPPKKINLNWDIGLWKQDSARAVPIKCPENSQATLLRLTADKITQMTVCERVERTGHAWRMKNDNKPKAISIAKTHQELVSRITGIS